MQRAAESDLRGEDSVRVWQEARRLAPRSAVIGVNTALALERAGRKSDAERVLIETERMNRLWLPRWSLASFYLRQQRPEDAARWARLALERSNAGVRPALFGLLAQVGVPTTEWLSWCGGSPEMVAGALEYFGEAGKPAELADATRLLAALGPGRSPAFWRDSLKGACSRLILAGNGAAAVEAWNSLIARNALPYDLIGPSNLIGNPGFAEPVDGEAFNWKFHPLHGVSRILDSRTRTLRLRFDGSQPEASELLATEVWLEPAPQAQVQLLLPRRRDRVLQNRPCLVARWSVVVPVGGRPGEPLLAMADKFPRNTRIAGRKGLAAGSRPESPTGIHSSRGRGRVAGAETGGCAMKVVAC